MPRIRIPKVVFNVTKTTANRTTRKEMSFSLSAGKSPGDPFARVNYVSTGESGWLPGDLSMGWGQRSPAGISETLRNASTFLARIGVDRLPKTPAAFAKKLVGVPRVVDCGPLGFLPLEKAKRFHQVDFTTANADPVTIKVESTTPEKAVRAITEDAAANPALADSLAKWTKAGRKLLPQFETRSVAAILKG